MMSGLKALATIAVLLQSMTALGAAEEPDGEALTGARWWLTGILDGPAFGEAWFTVTPDGAFTGDTGCNRINGSAKVDGDTIDIGPLASTKMACVGEPATEQDARFLSILSGKLTYGIQDGQLRLEQPADGASLTFARRAAGQETLTCKIEKSVGYTLSDKEWTDANGSNSDDFTLTPVPLPPCENDDFTCQARNPNYQLSSDSMRDDFVGCYRVTDLDFMSCDVFTSTLKVNFAKGVFSILDDDGGLFSGQDKGSVHLRVGRCISSQEETSE